MQINETINNLTLIRRNKGPNGIFRCLCGVEKEIRVSAVKGQGTKSCGCHRKESARTNGKKVQTHGDSYTSLYTLWAGLKHKRKLHHCFYKYQDFKDWASDKYKPGLVPYSSYKLIDKDAKFITNLESKNLNTEKTCTEKYGSKTPLQSEEIQAKIKKTNLERYGFENPTKSDIVKQITIENNLKKYGVEYPQHTQEYRQKMSDINTKDTYKGKTRKDWAEDLKISRSCFNQRVQKYGFEIAVSMEKNQTEIESLIEIILKDNNLNYTSQTKLDCYIPDFILPDHYLIIEADGLYWHSDAVNNNKHYHKEKMLKYKELGYFPLFFLEDEIINKKEIVESIILNKCQINEKRYFARKCTIKEIKDKKEFFNKNHLMGVGRGKAFGLFYGDKVVCGLQYTVKNGLLDVSRFCPILKNGVIGGYTKLLSYIEKLEKPDTMQTFIDKRYGDGSYLEELGYVKKTEYLSFKWAKNCKTEHRMKFRSNAGYDLGYNKIWDCGQAKYVKVGV